MQNNTLKDNIAEMEHVIKTKDEELKGLKDAMEVMEASQSEQKENITERDLLIESKNEEIKRLKQTIDAMESSKFEAPPLAQKKKRSLDNTVCSLNLVAIP